MSWLGKDGEADLQYSRTAVSGGSPLTVPTFDNVADFCGIAGRSGVSDGAMQVVRCPWGAANLPFKKMDIGFSCVDGGQRVAADCSDLAAVSRRKFRLLKRWI